MIFSKDVKEEMRKGAEQDIRDAWALMPDPRLIGEENFLDLLEVRYRFPNYGGIGQSWMDEQILSIMPLRNRVL
jgi:hypothetical protein